MKLYIFLLFLTVPHILATDDTNVKSQADLSVPLSDKIKNVEIGEKNSEILKVQNVTQNPVQSVSMEKSTTKKINNITSMNNSKLVPPNTAEVNFLLLLFKYWLNYKYFKLQSIDI